MNTMKKVAAAVAMVLVGGMAYGAVSDAFEVSVTPSVQYAVTITTPAAGLAFTGVAPNTTYVNLDTATVKNTGNVSADWTIKGTALDNWTLAAAPGNNAVRLLGVLKTVNAISGDFNTTDDVINAEANMTATNYAADQNGNNVAVNAEKLLSVRLDSPTDTTYDTTQKFRVEIKAYPASRF
jgi:hypothetical protein